MKSIFEKAKEGQALITSRDEMRLKELDDLINKAYDERDDMAEMLMNVIDASYYAGYMQGYSRALKK